MTGWATNPPKPRVAVLFIPRGAGEVTNSMLYFDERGVSRS
jgi:hypothetical protein